jgi:hypothetical protein
MGIVWSANRRGWLLLTTEPYVVWNGTQEVVARISAENSTKSILKVVSTTSLKANSVNIKPRTPEKSTKPVHMAVDDTASVVSEAQIND